MITQLNPPIPLSTPKGEGLAWLVIDYGAEHNLMWVVAIDSTGEVWTFSNPEVTAQKNITMGRKFTFPKPSDQFKGALIMDDPKENHEDKAKDLNLDDGLNDSKCVCNSTTEEIQQEAIKRHKIEMAKLTPQFVPFVSTPNHQGPLPANYDPRFDPWSDSYIYKDG